LDDKDLYTLIELCNPQSKFMNKIVLNVLALLVAGMAFAQEDSTKAKDLEEVVITTGQYRPQSLKNSVYQVRVITKERIQKQGATKLQDVLNNELNIRFSQDLATGGSNINMLGLSGQNVKILVDGLPMIGRQGFNNEFNINQIDVNSIERIELVEGPMSVMYGADALAGVINIITKKAGSAKISVNARATEETVGKEYGVKGGIHNQYGGVSLRHKKWEIGGGVGYYYFGGFKDSAVGRELIWHWKDQITSNGFLAYNGEKLNIRYRFDGLDEVITNPGNFLIRQEDADDTLAQDQEYLSKRLMHQLQGNYFVNSNLSFQAQSSYSDYRRQVFSTTVSKKTGQFYQDVPERQAYVRFQGLTFRGMAAWKLSSIVSLQPGVDINIETGKGERLTTGLNQVNDYAFFVSSEITPNSRVNIRPGLRFIKNSVYDAPPVIPSINTKFGLTKNIDLRLAYAHGFRSPSLRELYFNFFDANHQLLGNPNLKAETSDSYTGSLSWRNSSLVQGGSKAIFTATLSGFWNDVKNQIDFGATPQDPNILQYINIASFKTRGASLAGTAYYRAFNASLGVSYTGRFNQFAEDDKSLPEFKWSPEVNANIGYSFAKLGLDLNLFYKMTGKLPFYTVISVNNQQVLALSETESYNWMDFTVSKKLFKLFTVNAGIKNIFDITTLNNTLSSSSGTHGSSTASAIAYGRSYFAGLAFNWDKK
jgi:outer membrane receptor for ferrienterochelin and colicins